MEKNKKDQPPHVTDMRDKPNQRRVGTPIVKKAVEFAAPPKKIPFREFVKDDNIQNYFRELIGERAPSFLTSIAEMVEADKRLPMADNQSIVTAAAESIKLDLSLDANLGLAYITAYKDRTRGNKIMAQFSIGWKGLVQLCHRSGLFHKIHVELVHEGEFGQIDRMTGDMTWHWEQNNDIRDKLPVIGVVAYFRLLNGFEKSFWLTVDQLEIHAKTYSDEYRTQNTGPWKDNKSAMQLKTTVKLLLDKWGPKSIETKYIQRAIQIDQAVLNDMDGNSIDYIDNKKEKMDIEDFNRQKDTERTMNFIKDATTLEMLETCYAACDNEDLGMAFALKKKELIAANKPAQS